MISRRGARSWSLAEDKYLVEYGGVLGLDAIAIPDLGRSRISLKRRLTALRARGFVDGWRWTDAGIRWMAELAQRDQQHRAVAMARQRARREADQRRRRLARRQAWGLAA